MKHLLNAAIIIITVAMLTGCATLAAQPQPAAEPDAAVAKTKAVDAYVFIPKNATDQEATKATITGDDETVRWVPLKITVNVPVPEGPEGGE